jgi:hypothetical protein
MKFKCGKLRPRVLPVGLVIGIISGDINARVARADFWYSIGPMPINIVPSPVTDPGYIFTRVSGRVTALAVDPGNPSHFLLGAAQGGVWETANAGATWNPRTDDQASLAIGAIAFAPNQPSLVYAGTGEANFRGDAYAGAGLLQSQDGGTTWQMLNSSFAGTSFSHIAVNPFNAGNLAVATVRGGAGVGEESSGHGSVPYAPSTGVYVSTDGGGTFHQVLTGQATALVADPAMFTWQYAGLGEIYGDPANGVYRTRDGWQTSQTINGPWTTLAPSGLGRIAMAISPTDPSAVYVGVAVARTRYVADLLGIWVTTDAWADMPTWTALPKPAYSNDGTDTPRFWYYFDLLVDPADSRSVYLAEFNVWQYASGNWAQLTGTGAGFKVHVDNHVMEWVPAGAGTYQMLLGNDGGVNITQPGNYTEWSDLNATLGITQFYKGALSITDQNVLALGGAQDNDVSLYTGNLAWRVVAGGDGGDCAISSFNPQNFWAVSAAPGSDTYEPNNDYDGQNSTGISEALFELNGAPITSADQGITDALPFSEQFFVHFEKSPTLDNLFIAGTASLWRCDNFFDVLSPSWSRNSPMMLDNQGNPVPISAMAFAPWDSTGLVYAFGTEDGQLRITSDGGASWQDLDPAGLIPPRYVSGLAFSPTDTEEVYVTLSGLDKSTPLQPGHLFATIDAFTATPNWENISPPPDLPNNCLAIDPNNAANIYVGTDIGVWNSTDGGLNWNHYGPDQGMPNVAVYDLRFAGNGQLAAFTHGRGAYLLARPAPSLPMVVYVGPPSVPLVNCPYCHPAPVWVNPGDLITFKVPLQSILPIDTVDLKAVLLPSPDIQPVSGTQDYGVLQGQGPPVSRTFQFIAGRTNGDLCGQTVQAVFQLQDQGTNLGTISVPLQLGVPSHRLVEDFHEVQVPALAAGWSSTGTGDDLAWITTTNEPPNLPDSGEDDLGLPTEVTTSVFVCDTNGVGESILTSPPFMVATSLAQLSFRMAFLLPGSWDGGIMEISVGGQPFQEFLQAGGSFVQGGYGGILSLTNSLGPIPAWTGNSGGWVPILAGLPTNAVGSAVQLRWHFASSLGQTNAGWFIDSVAVTESICLPPVSSPVILNPTHNGSYFSFIISTVTNRAYSVEYTTNLANGPWHILESLPGSGSTQVISVPATNRQTFYRFYVQ